MHIHIVINIIICIKDVLSYDLKGRISKYNKIQY